MGKPFDFPIHKLCKQILSKVTALPDTIAAVKTAVADVAKYVVTNNTAKKDGIISQKISYLIQSNENHGSVERTTAGSQNWTCPAGVYFVYVIIAGAGGGGGGGGAGIGNTGRYKAGGSGGGSGGLGDVIFALINVTPGAVYALTVGTGGTGGTGGVYGTSPVGGRGGAGGASKFGSILSVTGGTGGYGGLEGDQPGEYETGWAAPKGGNGGSHAATPTGKVIILHEKTAPNGSAGAAGVTNDSSSETGSAAGGSAVTFSLLGTKSGAGGAGGKSKYTGDGTNGSAGATGGAGYIKIMW